MEKDDRITSSSFTHKEVSAFVGRTGINVNNHIGGRSRNLCELDEIDSVPTQRNRHNPHSRQNQNNRQSQRRFAAFARLFFEERKTGRLRTSP
jgi:hypothetical protein